MAKKKNGGDGDPKSGETAKEAETPDCPLCLMGSSQDPTRAHQLGTKQHP